MNSVINGVYKAIRLLAYRFERLKVLNKKGDDSSIQLLYIKYLDKVINGDIFPERQRSNDEIFIRFRNEFHGRLSDVQEGELLELLNGNISKWFVPCLLNTIDSFSKKLMIQLIETAIDVKDLSYNESFLRPVTRVYDLEVHRYLLKRFEWSTIKEKKEYLELCIG